MSITRSNSEEASLQDHISTAKEGNSNLTTSDKSLHSHKDKDIIISDKKEDSNLDNQDQFQERVLDEKELMYLRMKHSDRKSDKLYYEVTFAIRSDAASSDIIGFCERILDIVRDDGGKVHKIEYWGLRSLRYRIKKNRKAHFYSLQIDGNKLITKNISRAMRMSELVIRHILLRISSLYLAPSTMVYREKESSNKVHWDDKYLITL